jgi:hypothetical protein
MYKGTAQAHAFNIIWNCVKIEAAGIFSILLSIFEKLQYIKKER